jgi:hypothetical protein
MAEHQNFCIDSKLPPSLPLSTGTGTVLVVQPYTQSPTRKFSRSRSYCWAYILRVSITGTGVYSSTYRYHTRCSEGDLAIRTHKTALCGPGP